MEWFNLFIGFFIANVLGYGGGPSSIPLMYNEIVPHYQWLTDAQFTNMLALGNTLPGPIATKIAAYVGYNSAGILGLTFALAATIVPSAIAFILLAKLLKKFKSSLVVKGMTLLVQPVIAVMMVVLTWQLSKGSVLQVGWIHFILIAAVSFWAMKIKNIHPALVILCSFIYGAIFLSGVII